MAAETILKNHKNRDITAMDWPIFAKFGMVMQNRSLHRPDGIKIWISKIQDGGRPPFWKPLNRHISANVWPILMKFGSWRRLAPYGGQTVKISNFSKTKMAVAAILKITKIAISPKQLERSLRNLAWLYKIGLLTVLTVKKFKFPTRDWQIFAKFGTIMQNGSLKRPHR